MIQWQDGKVTCEAEGASVATLLWKKETYWGDVDVPKSWVTNIVDRATNRVQAVLKITNATLADSGVYKCIVSVRGKSDYKKTRIRVDCKFVCFCITNNHYHRESLHQIIVQCFYQMTAISKNLYTVMLS